MRPSSGVPVSIMGIWVGLLCIVLLVSSAAALRSVFGGKLRVANQAGSVASAEPTGSGMAIPMPTSSPGSTGAGLSIGGPGQPSGGFGALAIRDRLSAHVRLKKVGLFVDDLEQLVKVEPTAIERPDVRKMITDTAAFAMTPTPDGQMTPDAKRLFEFLTERAGPGGPDVLFDLVTTKGGSRAASYADELLRQKEIVAKGTAALQVANDLRTIKSCKERAALFPRVQAVGDRRVLQFLFQMARCGKGPESCCMANDPRYTETVRVINAKK